MEFCNLNMSAVQLGLACLQGRVTARVTPADGPARRFGVQKQLGGEIIKRFCSVQKYYQVVREVIFFLHYCILYVHV